MVSKALSSKHKLLIFYSVNAIMLVLLTSFLLKTFFSSRTFGEVIPISEYETYDKWDGQMTYSFEEGNGTESNPYQIKTARELMFMKSQLENDNSYYTSAYYELKTNISLNNKMIYAIKNFKGHFNGNGYSIAQTTIKSYSQNTGLFENLDGAEIKNLNLKAITISDNYTNVGILAGKSSNSKITDIGIYDSSVSSGGLLLGDSTNDEINAVFVNGNVPTGGSLIGNAKEKLTLKNIVSYTNNLKLINNNSADITYDNLYSYVYSNDAFTFYHYYFNGKEENHAEEENSLESLAMVLTSAINELFEWKKNDKILSYKTDSGANGYNGSSTEYEQPSTDLHATGIEGDTVYVNELESSWNNYMGFNYTSNYGYLPTVKDKSTYSKANLAPVYLTYNGIDIDNVYKGYVSLTERQTRFIYYEYYPIIDGYVNVRLIDNPFTDYSSGKGFNGWITPHGGTWIYYDKDTHAWYARIKYEGTPIDVTFYASWIDAKVYEINTTNNVWNNAFNALDSGGLRRVYLPEGKLITGFYKKITVPGGSKIGDYYDANGARLSGNCSGNTCQVYEFIQFWGSDGVQVVKPGIEYYYMATRDTNIVVMRQNQNTTWSNLNNKPFTLTSVYGGRDYRNSATWDVKNLTVNCYADTEIRNIKIKTGLAKANNKAVPTSSTTTPGYLFGRWHNVRLGKGIISDNNTTFNYVIGGTSENIGSERNAKKYQLTIESGVYNSIALVQGDTKNNYTDYIKAYGVYGNDYDRIRKDNNKLDVAYVLTGTFGGTLYSTGETSTMIESTILSGKFGSNKFDYTTGVIVGGTSGGTHYASKQITVKGGYIYNLIGGALTSQHRVAPNDVYIYQTGGEIETIFGGAENDATYGNRIIQLTGGIVNHSVFGGSNGYLGKDGDGTIKGSSYIYLGGNITVGSDSNYYSNKQIYGAESGSVFGIGNGREGDQYSTIGSNDNANIVITGNAKIKRNVYGGGNYGSTGTISYYAVTETNILVAGGTIEGSIYGGGNNNGSGSNNKPSTVTINMVGGTVKGSIFGGSKTKGITHGSSYINVYGGTVEQDIYGGGEGKETSVERNVIVTIGNRSYTVKPLIKGDVYGGSAFGTVNAINRCADKSLYEQDSLYTTSVIMNAGTINGSIFGGGEGNSSASPNICGNIIVSLNEGRVSSIYGGNDLSGVPVGTISVYLNSGFATDVFGGGNKADVKNTSVYLNGATIKNIYGGGNNAGAEITKVVLKNGNVTNVFGGSNESGNVDTAQITTYQASSNTNLSSDLTMDIEIANGENVWWYETVDYKSRLELKVNVKNASPKPMVKWVAYFKTTDSYLRDNWSSVNISDVNSTYSFDQTNRYWGNNTVPANGEFSFTFWINSYVPLDEFQVTSLEIIGYDEDNNVYTTVIDELKVKNLFGGNNLGGKVKNASINLSNIEINNIYGGGNKAIVEKDAYVRLKDATILTNVYGGGVEATVDSSKVFIYDTTVNGTVYGGGNYGAVNKDSKVVIENASVDHSVYGGGEQAPIYGNTTVLISGDTKIGESVFGGGDSGPVGKEGSSSSTSVNVIGGEIGKNVYGGCNTSVVYGTTDVKIGSAYETDDYERKDIIINGTVFGGGEANSEGSEIYDYKFISVTEGIDVQIDGKNYGKLDLLGSIFGSGNASSSTGDSNVTIKNLGKKDDIITLISIQRATNLTIDNSFIEILGATDRTNDYSSIRYTFNRIDLLKIKNNTTLYLQQNANLLQELRSLVDIDGKEVKAQVTIDEEGNSTKNVDNRIYMLADRNLNVSTNEAATSYGRVSGMTFLGMYNKGEDYYKGIYAKENNDEITDDEIIFGGSYVLGLHLTDHDIKVDGFYSNFPNEDYNKLITKYVEPTPEDASYYMWAIGIETISYSFNITASKYSSLGTYDLKLLDFPKGNSTFNVVNVDTTGLIKEVDLINPTEVKKIGETDKEINYTYGLSMKSETPEWTSNETTSFIDKNGGTILGNKTYLTDSTSEAPIFTFYLYHAKNITLDKDLGEVKITLRSLVPKNEIEYDIQFVTITVAIDAKTYTDEPSYDASITYGKKYEMPSLTSVNITNDSSFTAYYSLLVEADSMNKIYGNRNDSYHVLTSNYVLPVNTKITMIDLSNDDVKYYYYKVDQNSYNTKTNELRQNREVTYRLSDFIVMDSLSTNNKYNDYLANQKYYHQSTKLAYEEFLFIVDFKDANIEGSSLNNSMIMELRTSEDRTSYSVLGIRQPTMVYNLYETSNVVLNTKIDTNDNFMYYDIEKDLNYKVTVDYDKTSSSESIIDTNYEENAMGMNISLIDSSGNMVSSSLLVGTSITIDDVAYYPSSDGIFRIKLTNKVSNYEKKLTILPSSKLPNGKYKIKMELFSSSDGLHKVKADTVDNLEVIYIGETNSIDASIEEENKLIDLNTKGEKTISSTIKYQAELTKPNLRLSLYKRNIDNYNSLEYEEINLKDISDSTFFFPSMYGYPSIFEHEYMVTTNVKDKNLFDFKLKNEIETGTYKLVFRLYDENNLIEEDEEYFIVTKGIN